LAKREDARVVAERLCQQAAERQRTVEEVLPHRPTIIDALHSRRPKSTKTIHG
jgi:hypothetical protein